MTTCGGPYPFCRNNDRTNDIDGVKELTNTWMTDCSIYMLPSAYFPG